MTDEPAAKPARPQTMSWDAFIRGSGVWRADAELAADLAAFIPDTTDDS